MYRARSKQTYLSKIASLYIIGLFIFSVLVLPSPANALSGQKTITFHTAFSITYSNISGKDFIWWDWRVLGRVADLSYKIEVTDFHSDKRMADGGNSNVIHNEWASGSKGQTQLIDNYHTAVVEWTSANEDNVTFIYDVRLDPPDLTPHYIAVGAIAAVPAAFIIIVIYRERTRPPPTKESSFRQPVMEPGSGGHLPKRP